MILAAVVVGVVSSLTVLPGLATAATTPARPTHWGPTRTLTAAQLHTQPLQPVGGASAHASTARDVVESRNWAGVIDTGSRFSSVSGDWTVPTVRSTSYTTGSATWLGIDGTSTSSLIQTGTAQNSYSGGTDYFAWYEILPSAPMEFGVVSPGDVMSASIVQNGPTTWTISMTDVTSGDTAQQQVSYSTPGDSAEWIEEAPTSTATNQVQTLADFGTARFTDIATTATGSVTGNAVEMVDDLNNVIAYPTNAGPSGFSVVYVPPSDGYDLVGSDGGVFVFHGNFYGSLPGLGVHVDDITGIVPTATDTGYFLVGADGGVFAFHAPFANSLPGLGVHVNDIVGIVPTLNDRGYFLVGADGGVFSFHAPFANSLPGLGVHVDDITGIAATADDQGYWLVGANGSVYAFGDARYHGSAPAGAVGITATHDGGGYWVVGANGAVSAFGDAGNFGDLPGLGVPVDNIVGIVVSPDSQGYNLIGSDGGVFSFGDAQNEGSLPGLGVHVDNVVGAVPT
jgi:hypothetical protein